MLCTQLLPLDCAQCLHPTPLAASQTCIDTTNTRVYESHLSIPLTTDQEPTASSHLFRASSVLESPPPSPAIEKHPLFVNDNQKQETSQQFPYGRAQGDTCASCSFSIPQEIAARLPEGAPGSVKSDGKGKNGSPVLRSRQLVCLGDGEHSATVSLADRRFSNHVRGDENGPSSYQSDASTDSACHDHLLTYLTSRNPDDPASFSALRASVIRTLSCELLPRGMSDGPFCFGDSFTGYTIAYVFRLTDPKARGRRRAYAFVALAGKDASRAFRACPMVWEAFAAMAQGIEEAAQRAQEEQKQREEKERENDKSSNYTPISSFLTQRTVDPDGFPRRVGQISPRSLAEIVGDEKIFAVLHQYFVGILRLLGDRFGGLPFSNEPVFYRSAVDEKVPTSTHAERVVSDR